MKDNKIKQYSKEELIQKIKSETEALQKLKFAHRISAIENPVKIKSMRRLIARLKTALHELTLQSQ